MANRLSLRIMKFFVDFLYYVLPFISFLLKVAFWALVVFLGIVAICIIL